MAVGLPVFSKFDVYSDKNSVRIRWAINISTLKNLFTGMTIDTTRKKEGIKIALL